MSSTGLIDFNANYINSDIIDVNEKLTVNNIDIIELINNNFYDLSENIQDLSQNVINKITDLSQNTFDKINDLSQNVINKINDLSGNVKEIKDKNDAQGVTILCHSLKYKDIRTQSQQLTHY
jgi:hypothetical protein